jgi:hypothetical protein
MDSVWWDGVIMAYHEYSPCQILMQYLAGRGGRGASFCQIRKDTELSFADVLGNLATASAFRHVREEKPFPWSKTRYCITPFGTLYALSLYVTEAYHDTQSLGL